MIHSLLSIINGIKRAVVFFFTIIRFCRGNENKMSNIFINDINGSENLDPYLCYILFVNASVYC